MNVLGLCAGIGGLELGIPGAEAVCFVESDTYAQQVLAKRWPQTPIWSDVSNFEPGPWRNRVDCITAGFPCQPWSVAGKQRGTDDARWIWGDISRIIREVGPQYVFLENVPGLISGGGLALVLGDLAQLGFDAEWGVFSAAGSGAPHIRRRLFILAHANGDQLRDQPRWGYGQGWSGKEKPPNNTKAGLWWATESRVGRVAHGVPSRVDRLRCLGNAVVPQVAARAWATLGCRGMNQ
jgi:DNA (cytosine-5)-methyltransferase 1